MTATLHLSDKNDTRRLAHIVATNARAGLCVLLDGPVGAGKTFLARHIILDRLAALGRPEDIPSPTFTIIQTYDAGEFEIWHADLYRLTSTNELAELGLDIAFETAFCLIEWPDRLGDKTPPALTIDLEYGQADEARVAQLSGATDEHKAFVYEIEKAFSQ